LTKYTIFLADEGSSYKAFGVLGLDDPLTEIFGPGLPKPIETVLLPFKGKIVYDGLAVGYNIGFASGAKKMLNEEYKQAKEKFGIITSLPFEGKKQKATSPTKRSQKQKRPNKRMMTAAESLSDGIEDVEMLIQEEGLDPVFAAYSVIQNFTSRFAQDICHLPELKAWTKEVEKAEDEYMPMGPPMSPLTGSFFWTWALYDLCIDKSTDTMACRQLARNDVLQMSSSQLDVTKNLANSRMGIYEHIGMKGPHILLRELITDSQLLCHCASEYRGRKGELWYVRLVPPLEPQQANYWVTITTPYILTKASKADWIDFLKRTMVQCDGPDEATRLYNLFKRGLEPNYWNEFVCQAYHNYQYDAIFLAGIPDMKKTLPHASRS